MRAFLASFLHFGFLTYTPCCHHILVLEETVEDATGNLLGFFSCLVVRCAQQGKTATSPNRKKAAVLYVGS